MDMSNYELTERDVDQREDIRGVDTGAAWLSPIYLLRLAKQSGIIQAQVEKVITMLELE